MIIDLLSLIDDILNSNVAKLKPLGQAVYTSYFLIYGIGSLFSFYG